MDNFGGSIDDWEYVKDDFTYLTEIGKAGARRQIRKERTSLKKKCAKTLRGSDKKLNGTYYCRANHWMALGHSRNPDRNLQKIATQLTEHYFRLG